MPGVKLLEQIARIQRNSSVVLVDEEYKTGMGSITLIKHSIISYYIIVLSRKEFLPENVVATKQ